MSDFSYGYGDTHDMTPTETGESVEEVRAEESEPNEAPAPTEHKPRRTKRASKPKNDAAHIIDTYEKFILMDDADLSVVAGLLGTDTTPRNITLACLDNAGESRSTVEQIVELYRDSEMEATLRVVGLSEERKSIKPLWTALVGLDVLNGEMGRNRLDVARSIVTAIRSLSDDQVRRLEHAAELLN